MSEETTVENPLQRGIDLLRAWLEEHELSANRWAIDNRIDPAQVHQLLRGLRKRMSVDLAARIERGTEGSVPSSVWIQTEGSDEA